MGVENDEEFFVEPPEGSRSEVELPQRGTDGFEGDELVSQRHGSKIRSGPGAGPSQGPGAAPHVRVRRGSVGPSSGVRP